MPKRNELIPAPIIKVQKASPFIINEFYLDDLNKLNVVSNLIYFNQFESNIFFFKLKYLLINHYRLPQLTMKHQQYLIICTI